MKFLMALCLSLFVFASSNATQATASHQNDQLASSELKYQPDGFLWFIEKPTACLLKTLSEKTQSLPLAIIILTLGLKILSFPLQFTAHKSMKAMRKLQPQLEKIKEDYGDDPILMHQKIRSLYQAEKLNPLLGIAPLLLQAPIFIALYSVLDRINVTIGPESFAWITDLGSPDSLFILPALIGLTMLLTQKFATVGTPESPKWIKSLPTIAITGFSAFAPAGVAIYLLTSTVFQTVSQIYLEKFTRI